jgi:hypothetical protein
MNWYSIIKFAGYDEFSEMVERLSRNNPYPFSDWFDDGDRVYIPIIRPSNADSDVEELLNENNCVITDYGKGYCEKNGQTRKIGKFLDKLRRQELKDLQIRFDNDEIYNLEREQKSINEYYDKIIQTFMNSPARSNKGQAEFYVVISQNPHDVASMSTGRSWTSCMDLEGGAHHEDIYVEVRNGGLVAYLVRASDSDIEDPLARIRIRRFVNKDGESVAKAEDSTYGNSIEGFPETVNQWLSEKQPKIKPGYYELKGGSYSDTFDSEEMFAPSNQEDVISWLRGESEDAVISTWEIVDEMYNDISEETHGDILLEQFGIENRNQTFPTKEEAERVFQYMNTEISDMEREQCGGEWNEYDEEESEWVRQRYTLEENVSDNRKTMQRKAIEIIISAEKGAYPEDVIKEVKNILFNPKIISGRDSLRVSFSKKYPEMLSDDDIGLLSINQQFETIKELPEERRQEHIDSWRGFINRNLDHPEDFITSNVGHMLGMEDGKPVEHYFADNSVKPYSFVGKISMNIEENIFSIAREIYSPIPEPVIAKMIDLVHKFEGKSDVEALHKRGKIEDRYPWLASRLVHTFAMTNSDTPSVQNYYKSLLKYWGNSHHIIEEQHSDMINIRSLGYGLAKLGRNGLEFLPFLKEKLKKQQELKDFLKQNSSKTYDYLHREMIDREIESYLYVIDSIENGEGRSKKYKMSSRDNWYKKGNSNSFRSNWYKQIKLAESTWTRGQVYTDSKDNSYDVGILEELAKNLDLEHVDVKELYKQLEEDVWGDLNSPISPIEVINNPNKNKEFKSHYDDINSVNTKKPILIRESNQEVIDGYHRLSKAFMEKVSDIPAKFINEELLEKSKIEGTK